MPGRAGAAAGHTWRCAAVGSYRGEVALWGAGIFSRAGFQWALVSSNWPLPPGPGPVAPAFLLRAQPERRVHRVACSGVLGISWEISQLCFHSQPEPAPPRRATFVPRRRAHARGGLQRRRQRAGGGGGRCGALLFPGLLQSSFILSHRFAFCWCRTSAMLLAAARASSGGMRCGCLSSPYRDELAPICTWHLPNPRHGPVAGPGRIVLSFFPQPAAPVLYPSGTVTLWHAQRTALLGVLPPPAGGPAAAPVRHLAFLKDSPYLVSTRLLLLCGSASSSPGFWAGWMWVRGCLPAWAQGSSGWMHRLPTGAGGAT